jgi:hypothetical protein
VLFSFRLIAFVLALTLSFGSVVRCVAAIAAAEPAMACHDTEQHQRPQDSSRFDCCPGEAPNSQGFVPGQQALDESAPSPVLLGVLAALPAPLLRTRAGVVDAADGTPKPPGIATYLLVSSFRI